MAENQEQAKPKEREIPVFTVLKNNCILKNIFVLDNPPSISSSSSALGAEIADQKSEREEILLVGRHPDCNIKLEHPSISRFHLRIHSKPSSRSLFVTDLSSVHGTCISGKRIEAGVMMELFQGDTLKLGESSRLYRLDWVPMSSAYDINDPFVPQLDSLDTVDEETEEAADQDENSLYRVSDEINVLGWQFSEEDLGLSMEEMTAKEAPMFEGLCHSYQEKDEEENSQSPEMCNKENEISGSQLCPLDASFTADEETEGVINQDGDGLLLRNDGHDLGESMEDLERSFVDEDLALSMQKMSAESPLQLEDEMEIVSSPEICEKENELCSSLLCPIEKEETPQNEDEAENTSSPEIFKNENEFSSSQLCQIEEANITPQVHILSAAVLQNVYEAENISSPEQFKNENEFSSSQLCQIEEVNITPQVHILSAAVLQKVSEAETVEDFEMNSEKRLGMNIWSRRGKSEGVKIKTSRSKATCARINMSVQVKSLLGENCVDKSMLKDQFASPGKDEEIFTPDKENASPDSCLVRSLGSKFDEAFKSESISNTPASSVDEDEVFTSDKENMTPNDHLFRHRVLHKPSPLKTASRSICQEEIILQEVTQQHKVLQERKSTNSASKSRCSLKKQPNVLRPAKREPFLPLTVISSGDDKSASISSAQECTVRGSASLNNSEAKGSKQSPRNTTKLIEKRWTIVVDTACLLSRKSRRELQLLRGLRGTSLVIPRIVLRELDCMVRRASFLSRMTEASAALQWIEECMASTTWWIHVQSSAEESRLVPPTPPATSDHWFSEDKCAFSVGSIPFSPYTLQEIVTPTAADHILESALFFKHTMNRRLVLLSDDVTLKIKAMAEGVMCETAKEFRASLVNPFSARFLYTDSSPRGPTWTCVDDTDLKEKYYPSPSKKATRSGEGAKGLKLILMHNSNFRQMRV